MEGECGNTSWNEPHCDRSCDVLGERGVQALQACERRKNTPDGSIVSKPSLSPVSIGDRELQAMQVGPIPQEFRDGREKVVIVDALAMEDECEVTKERKAFEVLSELCGGMTFEANPET